MSLLFRDIVLVTLVTLAGANVIYVQYFASYMLSQYAVWAWLGFAVSVCVFLGFSELGRAFLAYVKAARGEMRKVVWPTSDDVVRTTIAVGIAVAIFSVLVSVLDSVLVRMLAMIIG